MSCLYLALPTCVPPFDVSPASTSLVHGGCDIQTGPRAHRYISESGGVSQGFNYRFTLPYPVNYIYITRFDCSSGITNINLSGSNSGELPISVANLTDANFEFVGPNGQDLFIPLPSTITLDNWFISFVGGFPIDLSFNKLYFGELFDLGVAPYTGLEETSAANGRKRYSTSAKLLISSTGQRKQQYTIEWRGVDNAKAFELRRLMAFETNRYVGLVSDDGIQLINDYKALHCKVISFNMEMAAEGDTRVRMVLEQLIG